MQDPWKETKASLNRFKKSYASMKVAILCNWLIHTLDPNNPEDHLLLSTLFATKKEPDYQLVDPKDCEHQELFFGSGDYYIFCHSCNRTWTNTNLNTGMPDPMTANIRFIDQSKPRVLIDD